MITVLIVDNDKFFANSLKERLMAEGQEIQVVALSHTGEDAVNKILQLEPDIALIDLIMPVNDGLWILEELAAVNYTKTGIIAMSCFENDTISQMAIDLGAKYFMVKPFEASFLKRRILQVYRTLRRSNSFFLENEQGNSLQSFQTQVGTHVPMEQNINNDVDIEQIVSDMIIRMGVAPSLKGFHYLRSSVFIMLEEEDASVGITKKIYPDVAKMYKTTLGKVERAMRHAIDSAWKKNDGVDFTRVFGFSFNKKPTNGQLLASITEHVKLRYVKNRKP